VAFQWLVSLAEQGAIRTPVGHVYAFDEVPEAIATLESGAPAGKLIVRVA
jgi:NADPH:quinone reductase-like Zn-dependent oxidoreductase